MTPPILVFFAPLILAFEVCQLIIAERYLGVKQMEKGSDPRSLPMHEVVAALWSLGVFGTWAWMLVMLTTRFGQGQVMAMLAVTLLGYALRRSCPLRWVLVLLTFEGAIRIGMLVSLLTLTWQSS